MDYNWFLSATAQSTAAIIAIFSAFIITKIINNQKKYQRNLELFDVYENDSKKLKDMNNLETGMLTEINTWFKTEPQIRIEHHISRLKGFTYKVFSNPEFSRLISFSIISLLILFFVGVILPLYMLTSYQEVKIILFNFIMSFKNFQIILLLIISIIFTTIMIVFFIVNLKMKYDKDKIEKIKKYANIKYY